VRQLLPNAQYFIVTVSSTLVQFNENLSDHVPPAVSARVAESGGSEYKVFPKPGLSSKKEEYG
jgi:hypothetical protein